MPGTNFSLNKKNNSWTKFFIIIAIIIFVVLILNFFSSGIRNFFYTVSSPFQKTFWSVGQSSSGFLGSIFNAGGFAKENQNLKSENQKLLAQVSFLQSIVSANQAQSEVSLSCQGEQFKLQMATATGINDQDILTINKGSSSGISEGMPVINDQKALIGKVSKVYKSFSEVTLITNKNSVVSVKVLAEKKDGSNDQNIPLVKEIDGVVKGKGNNGSFLDLVPIDNVINQYDILVTSALDGIFPKDILVAKILKVEKNDQNPHQQAKIQLFSDPSSDNLFVITNYKQK